MITVFLDGVLMLLVPGGVLTSKKTFSCLGPTGYEYEVLMRAVMFSLALFHGDVS